MNTTQQSSLREFREIAEREALRGLEALDGLVGSVVLEVDFPGLGARVAEARAALLTIRSAVAKSRVAVPEDYSSHEEFEADMAARDPRAIAADSTEGNTVCPKCAAVVAWAGERPDDCLRCGAKVKHD